MSGGCVQARGRQHGAMCVPQALLLSALLPLQALAQPLELLECRSLRAQRDRLASEAMQAEIALVVATRRRLCPQQEALAERANANNNPVSAEPEATANANAHNAEAHTKANPVAKADTMAEISTNASAEADTNINANTARQGEEDLDYTAYLECRRSAEMQLQRSRPELYTNLRGFRFYTSTGARLARQADALQQRLATGCGAAG